jgi:hypothetical protein
MEFREFAEHFTYVYEEGLAIEIEDFFQRRKEQRRIYTFDIVFDRKSNHYKVKVSMTDTRPIHIRQIFFDLLQFISYSEATLWAREETNEGIHYFLVSLIENKAGFYCEIDFIASN